MPHVIQEKLYNTWTIWNVPNEKDYHQKITSFIEKKLKLVPRYGSSKKRNNHLIEFGIKMPKKNGKDFKCYILMASSNSKKDYIYINLNKMDKEKEAKLNSAIKKIVKKKTEKYKKYYYYVKFDESFEIDKRALAEKVGTDYDTMQYRGPREVGSQGGQIMIFKHKVVFLAYPSLEAIESDKKKILPWVNKNAIKA